MQRWFLLVALIIAIAYSPAHGQLLLAGGTLPVCTSLSPGNCEQPLNWDESALQAHRFVISDAAIARWRGSLDGELEPGLAMEWERLLRSLVDDAVMSRAELGNRLREAVLQSEDSDHVLLGETLIGQTDDREWWRLLDHLQQPTDRHREQVRLDNSRSQDAVEIFQRFVAMAAETSGRERPRIAVSTASSRDPYDALTFYLQVFDQAGAEVVWLPLDRAVATARSANRCNDLAEFQAELLGTWDRARVHRQAFALQVSSCHDSDATLSLVDNIDGLFLNGGDQWLTFHAFMDINGKASPEWQRIMARLAAGEMVLGGTSAGAAVQSGPVMISNGSSRRALLDGAKEQPPPRAGCDISHRCPSGLQVDSLTFRRGGLGSFVPGIVDTHFSERWRQFRLLQLMVDSGVNLGLGVDETSAMEVQGVFHQTGPILRSHGASGGWLISSAYAELEQAKPLRIKRVLLHHLAPGSTLRLDEISAPAFASPEGRGASEPNSEDHCLELSDYDSFANLPMQFLATANDRPPCLRMRLDETSQAHSAFVAIPPAHLTSGRVSSWLWSLEVQPLDQ